MTPENIGSALNRAQHSVKALLNLTAVYPWLIAI
jgi:hypothetical protein